MSFLKSYSLVELEELFKKEGLNSLYLIKTGSMSYTGNIRSVNNGTLFMDLPLKFTRGDNPMYAPAIIEREEFVKCVEVPLSGSITITTKKEGNISGEIINVYNNRLLLKNSEIKTLYFQDFYDIE